MDSRGLLLRVMTAIVSLPASTAAQDPSRCATENIAGTDALTAVTFIRGPAGKAADIERELLSLTAPTRAEPGALRYDLYQSLDDPSDFMRFEVWRSPEALELHKATPHLKASFERRKNQGWQTQITLWRRVPD